MASHFRHLRARLLKAVFKAHAQLYKASDGRIGKSIGPMALGQSTLLLSVTGRKSGLIRTMVKRSLGIEKPNLENSIPFQRMIGSPGFPERDEELQSKVLDSVGRSLHPGGYSRHLAAIMASGSPVKLLKTVTVPTLVIRGRDDLLVPLECGIDTARHIPDARLEIIDGMGHNLPQALMPRLLELIAEHVGQEGAALPASEAGQGETTDVTGQDVPLARNPGGAHACRGHLQSQKAYFTRELASSTGYRLKRYISPPDQAACGWISSSETFSAAHSSS